MIKMTTYFNFMGNTEAAMNHYKAVFGGEFTSFSRFRDMPDGDKLPAADRDKIMHITLSMPNDNVIMATDALESMEQKVSFGNNYYVCVHTESEAETDAIFKGLSEDGKIEMPVNKTFWGAYCGMCRDKFGVQWMITFNYPTA